MCGKFTVMASWAEMVDISQHACAGPDGNDHSVTLRVMSVLPVIIWDKTAGQRRVVPMRWGFPDPQDWRRPQPIHARAETIDTITAFAAAFRDGQRGIVLARTFNEAPESGIQHTITPGDALATGIAFLWRRFAVADFAAPQFACVMVTVPANPLIAGLPADRMPAILTEADWAAWLGEAPASPAGVKACLKTVDGMRWTMTPEQRAAKPRRARPTVREPGGSLL